MPLNRSDKITPELPRAPRKNADEAISKTEHNGRLENEIFFYSEQAESIVIDIFVPVSPSGTGKIFKSSTKSLLFFKLLEAENMALTNLTELIKIKLPSKINYQKHQSTNSTKVMLNNKACTISKVIIKYNFLNELVTHVLENQVESRKTIMTLVILKLSQTIVNGQ